MKDEKIAESLEKLTAEIGAMRNDISESRKKNEKLIQQYQDSRVRYEK